MDAWTVIAYTGFGVSVLVSALKLGNWVLRANPQAIVNAGRWSLVGLGVAAVAVLLWLTASGRWTLATMLAAFMLPVFAQGAPRWRRLLGLLGVPGRGWPLGSSAFSGAARGLMDPNQARQAAAVLKTYLDQASRRGGRGCLSTEEALDLLGLLPGASPDQIRAAHRRLQQRVDPELGGTHYLRMKVDEARDVLLGQ